MAPICVDFQISTLAFIFPKAFRSEDAVELVKLGGGDDEGGLEVLGVEGEDPWEPRMPPLRVEQLK